LPATQTEYRARSIRHPAETAVRPAAPVPIESPVSSSLISSGGNGSIAQFPALPRPEALPPLAGDARMRQPSPIIRVPTAANALQSGLSLDCPDAIDNARYTRLLEVEISIVSDNCEQNCSINRSNRRS
jgi:hypothetical protein